MIFETWRSYFISWQMFKNKVWCPVSRKIRRYFHFLLSLAYPIDRLDWALFSVVILFRHWFPLLEKAEILALILPRNLPAVLIIFTGRGGAGNPPLPAGRGVHPWLSCCRVVKSISYIKIMSYCHLLSAILSLACIISLYRWQRDTAQTVLNGVSKQEPNVSFVDSFFYGVFYSTFHTFSFVHIYH